MTTGTQSPTLKKNVGLALLKKEYTELGTEVEVEIRSKRLKAIVTQHHFINDHETRGEGYLYETSLFADDRTRSKRDAMQQLALRRSMSYLRDIPESVRFKGEYNIKQAKSETALIKELTKLAAKNADLKSHTSFLGAGVYDHYAPVIVDHVISRSEFYTAYTPYQPEISQGELQAIFEFQTMICELTGMDIANSSMYDGGTALAEAAMLSAGHTKS